MTRGAEGWPRPDFRGTAMHFRHFLRCHLIRFAVASCDAGEEHVSVVGWMTTQMCDVLEQSERALQGQIARCYSSRTHLHIQRVGRRLRAVPQRRGSAAPPFFGSSSSSENEATCEETHYPESFCENLSWLLARHGDGVWLGSSHLALDPEMAAAWLGRGACSSGLSHCPEEG